MSVLDQFKVGVSSYLTTALQGIVEGEADDLKAYGQQILQAAVDGYADPDTIQQLKDQAKLLLQISNLRVAQQREIVFQKILSLVIDVSVKAVETAIAAAVAAAV